MLKYKKYPKESAAYGSEPSLMNIKTRASRNINWTKQVSTHNWKQY